MKLGPITLFQPMTPRGAGLLIASLHHPWSITWRWGLSYSPAWKVKLALPSISFSRHYRMDPGFNFSLCVFLPLGGRLKLTTQPNMPTRKGAP